MLSSIFYWTVAVNVVSFIPVVVDVAVAGTALCSLPPDYQARPWGVPVSSQATVPVGQRAAQHQAATPHHHHLCPQPGRTGRLIGAFQSILFSDWSIQISATSHWLLSIKQRLLTIITSALNQVWQAFWLVRFNPFSSLIGLRSSESVTFYLIGWNMLL